MASKPNKSNKSVNVVSELASIGDKKAQLAAQMAQLEQEEKELKFNRLKAIEAKVNALTAHFEVATLADVRNLILRVEKNTLFNEGKASTSERAPRTTLSDEQKESLVNDRRAGVQYSVLCQRYGISSMTVYKYCKEAGLVEARPTEAPAAAPASEPSH